MKNPTSAPPAPPRIRLLPDEVKSRIAAGEVIERPASVLKELVENALDAGARAIHVTLAGGGRELIRVRDDGEGMGPQDLALSIRRHATSKLTSADDLYTLLTLGFRGEALPSIGSVSRLKLTSRRRGSEEAWSLCVDGGAAEPVQPEAGAQGTTVEVRDLFFNLPARQKFLKGPGAEAAACTEMLSRLALVRPDVRFTLMQGRQEILDCPAWDSGAAEGIPLEAYAQRARAVLGPGRTEGWVNLAAEGPQDPQFRGYRVYGLITPPSHSQSNRSGIYLAVNGRPVKDRTLTTALLEAYRNLLPPRRYPAAVLFLELPGPEVDINVHPTKAEVRFRIPGLVFSLLHHAVREAFRPNLELAAPEAEGETPGSPAGGTFAAVQKAFDLWQGERTHSGSSSAAESASVFPGAAGPRLAPAYSPPPVRAPAQPLRPAAPLPPRPEAPALGAGRMRVLGQAGGAYIVAEDDEGVKLFDQHALHERILFERLMARARAQSSGDAQRLLVPEPLELSPAQAAAWSDPAARELLETLGYEIAEFGPRALAVQAVPTVLRGAAAARWAGDVLDALAAVSEERPAGSRSPDRAALREKAVYVLCCKGAIKAGERLTPEQMSALLEEFARVVGGAGYTCPHGRPLAVELSWADLERGVGRT